MTRAHEIAAYDPVVAHERILSSKSDDAVLRQLHRRVDERRARGESEADVLARFVGPYVAARTATILLWYAGWDAVPLMLVRPALAVADQGVVIAVRDLGGKVSLHPLESRELAHLWTDIKKAEIRAAYLTQEADHERSTTDVLSPVRIRRISPTKFAGETREAAMSQHAGVLGGIKGSLPTVAGLRPPWTPPTRSGRRAHRLALHTNVSRNWTLVDGTRIRFGKFTRILTSVDTDESLRFAATVWGLARLPPPPGVATPRPRTP